jgi:F420-non-reducing hydrogenase iron-sulfur subunit
MKQKRGPEREGFQPKILVFCCNWCSYTASDLAGTSRLKMAPNFRVIRVMCSGRVDPIVVLYALGAGMDGVLITGCHLGDCHYLKGNEDAKRRVRFLRSVLCGTGFEERVDMEFISASEPGKFQKTVNAFTDRIRSLGPNPLQAAGKPEKTEEKRENFVRHLERIFESTGSEPKDWRSTTEEEILDGFGAPVFDPEKCLGCGACSRICSENVIQMSDEGPKRAFAHYHWSCITCRQCEEACPNEAVKVEKAFDLKAVLARTLFPDVDFDMRKCSRCGRFFAPNVLLEHIGDTEDLEVPADIMNTCPECRQERGAEKLKRVFNFEFAP